MRSFDLTTYSNHFEVPRCASFLARTLFECDQEEQILAAELCVVRESHVARIPRYVVNQDSVMRQSVPKPTLPLDFADFTTALRVKVSPYLHACTLLFIVVAGAFVLAGGLLSIYTKPFSLAPPSVSLICQFASVCWGST